MVELQINRTTPPFVVSVVNLFLRLHSFLFFVFYVVACDLSYYIRYLNCHVSSLYSVRELKASDSDETHCQLYKSM